MVILKVIAKIVLLPVLIAVILFQWIGIFLTGLTGSESMMRQRKGILKPLNG